jgi:OFA family oxalate/formate antiporter-like MFS transporter
MKNRWVILLAGIIIQTILGGVYAWSIFVPRLVEDYGFSKGQCGNVFGVSIAVFTLAMIVGGRVLSRFGPRIAAFLGGMLFIFGYLLAARSGGQYSTLLVGIGVLVGAGIGFGYVCPLTVGMQWFPKRKGLITGVAVAGFGGGAIVLSAVAGYFMGKGMDVLTLFKWIGLVEGGLLILCALLLDTPDSSREKSELGVSENAPSNGGVFTRPFILCFAAIFVGTFSGLMVIGNLTPIAMGNGLTMTQAVKGVSFFALGNAVGRILWGVLFDRMHYKTIPALLAFFCLGLVCLFVSGHAMLFSLIAILLGFGFGGNFVIYASSVSKYFGVEAFPRLYPLCFLGYGLAGITGPAIGGYLADVIGSYTTSLTLSIGLTAAMALIAHLSLRVFADDRFSVVNGISEKEV